MAHFGVLSSMPVQDRFGGRGNENTLSNVLLINLTSVTCSVKNTAIAFDLNIHNFKNSVYPSSAWQGLNWDFCWLTFCNGSATHSGVNNQCSRLVNSQGRAQRLKMSPYTELGSQCHRFDLHQILQVWSVAGQVLHIVRIFHVHWIWFFGSLSTHNRKIRKK